MQSGKTAWFGKRRDAEAQRDAEDDACSGPNSAGNRTLTFPPRSSASPRPRVFPITSFRLRFPVSGFRIRTYRLVTLNEDLAPSLDLPRVAPVMVLPNALLFPNSLMPLYIFEPRYREMLRWVLAGQRVFCIAQTKPGVNDAVTTEDFHQTGGLGLVRACVGHEDGTSHLVLQGLARVRFTGFVQETPFRIAELRELPSESSADLDGEALVAKVLAVCAELRASGVPVPDAFDAQLAKIDDPSMLADVIAHAFLKDGARRQEVFDELRVGERLRLLIGHLRAEMGKPES